VFICAYLCSKEVGLEHRYAQMNTDEMQFSHAGSAMRRIAGIVAVFFAFGVESLFAGPPAGGTGADFEKAVAGVLARRCVSCHNASESKGGLNLTRGDAARKGGDSGPAIEAGDPGSSLLIERVTDGSMPPKGQGERLTPAEIAGIAAWVKAGAHWPEGRVLSAFEFTTDTRAGFDWWSLQPVRRPEVPQVQDAAWVRHPIDAFVLAKLEENGLSPAPEADRRTLIRRVKFDLLGLPPTPEEIAAFLADGSPDAYERLVDRFLASPHYGERWGRHWLDVARFGESDGFENDKLRNDSWHYRDYVIRSLNADKPYDQFVKEQLAGDVIAPVTHDGIIGSGFLVAGPWDEIQNVAKSETERRRAHEEQMEEMLAAVSQTFLGLTVNCSRCHDHKFDPISQVDYYRLKAVFEGVDHGTRPLLTPEEQQAHAARVAPINEQIAALTKTIDDLKSRLGRQTADHIAAAQFVAGRFGDAFSAKAGGLTLPAKPEYAAVPISVECWAKMHSKRGFNILVASHPKESAAHWELYTYSGSGEFSVYLPGYAPAEIKSGIDVTDGEWHHLAWTFDGETARLFVDARPVKEAAVKRVRTGGPTGPLWIGTYLPQKIGCDGVVDEVRISNSVRAIARIPEAPFAPDEQTVSLWHLDKAEGNRARDAIAKAEPATDGDEQNAGEALQARLGRLSEELQRKQQELAGLAPTLVYAGKRREPEPTVVYLRGDIKQPGPLVTPAAPAALRAFPGDLELPSDAPETERRRRFAAWVASAENPLTARVIVNRVWQHRFGNGLVETPSDFGCNGGVPSHRGLLDWLAGELVGEGRGGSADGGTYRTDGTDAWSLKRLHRVMLISATYRQSSQFNARAGEIDADNRLLWRFAPRRLEGEIVRDAMLAASGELNAQIGGPSFRPFTVTSRNTQFYHLFDDGRADFQRRTVYRINVNTGKSPFLDALDCPAPSLAVPKRQSTTTTLQALALMNDEFVLRQAEKLAARLKNRAPEDQLEQLRLAYQIVLGRTPIDSELDAAQYVASNNHLAAVCWALFNSSEFLYVK
jgi:mono/diheme cytochrome c family protein